MQLMTSESIHKDPILLIVHSLLFYTYKPMPKKILTLTSFRKSTAWFMLTISYYNMRRCLIITVNHWEKMAAKANANVLELMIRKTSAEI